MNETPALHAFRLRHDQHHLAAWHAHSLGQLYAISSGVLIMQSPAGRWVMPPGHIGWLPPRCEHAASGHGPLAGWSGYLALPWCADLPSEPCVLAPSPLIQAIVAQVADSSGQLATDRLARLAAVLCDELKAAEPAALALPMPHDRRLLAICEALLGDLGRTWDMVQWASWAGLSERSLGRHFMAECGLGFAQWRQRARLLRALEWLAQGQPVGEVATALGYETTSAFIAAFRREFGTTPGRYFGTTAGRH
ncbi:helix-turn-helix transcriptional regulator [Chitinimonas sp.]|uniref:AraC family transcriptional regulator n=1 Tax=Chitinimonas sp. TaxID=1934313 RepID=UPI002F953F37